MKRQAFALLMRNTPGVLSRISGLFSRRGYSIDSITAGMTQDPTVTRMTIVARGDDQILEQIKNQLAKLVDVIEIWVLPAESSVYRELALIKVRTDAKSRHSIIELANIFRGKVVDVSPETITVEITGDSTKAEAFIELIRDFEIIEIVKTGVTGLTRGL
jgi:acetolactate synthase-1/3 small subunit